MTTDASTIIPIQLPYWPELLLGAKIKVEILLLTARRLHRRQPRALELGAGHSTLWLAGLSDLTSVEHDHAWFSEVRRELHQSGISAEVWMEDPERFPDRVRAFPDDEFDLVYVDCVDDQRMPCLVACLPKLKTDGTIVLDDTHWEMLQPVLDMMRENEWTREVIQGDHVRHTGLTHYHHTTFFTRR